LSEARSVRKPPKACNGTRDFSELIQAAIFNGMPDRRALIGVTVLHCINQGKRGFALRQVVAEVLSETGFISLIVERIVNQLEGGADVPAIQSQGLLDGRCRIAQHRGDLCAGLE